MSSPNAELKKHRDRRMPVDLCDNPQRWLSSNSFAALLDVSPRTFQRLCSAGRVPPADLVFGRQWRWKLGTVQAFLETAGDHQRV